MRNRFLSAASAAALSLALIAGAAGAQDDLALQQLRDSATTSLAQLGMDTSMVDSLTQDQLLQLESTASGGDSVEDRRNRIEAILRDAEAGAATAGTQGDAPIAPVTGDLDSDTFNAVTQLEANTTQYLARIGLSDRVDVQALTLNQLMQIQLAQSGTDSVDAQRARVEQILD